MIERRMAEVTQHPIKRPVPSGSVTLVLLVSRVFFLFRQGWSQPQTEEDDEVTDVEGCRAAVGRGIGVP